MRKILCIISVALLALTACHKVTITLGGAVVYVVEDVLRFVRVTVDYAPAILGTWE